MEKALLILFGAILAEVVGSSMLKMSNGFKNVIPVIFFVIGYSLSFIGLAAALNTIPLGIAYAIWSGVGTTLTVTFGIIFFKEKVNKEIVLGVLCVLIGVILLNSWI